MSGDALPFGSTPLLMAVSRGDRSAADALLDAGADINQRSTWWAGGFGVLDSVDPLDRGFIDHLISRGATVDAHAAARLDMPERLAAILAADPAAARARGGDGQTPLHMAATVEIARMLLDAGADIDALDVDHESTPAQYMTGDRLDVARFLISRGCRTDILMAAAAGDRALVERMVQADPGVIWVRVAERFFPKRDPRAGGTIYIWTFGWNKTAETIAARHGHAELRDWLAARRGGRHGDWELAAAACDADLARVTALLDDGVVPGTGDEHGTTALHWAAFHGDLAMTLMLLAKGAPVDARERTYGGTPLGWAIHGSTKGWRCQTGDYGGVARALANAGAAVPPNVTETEMSDAVREALGKHGL